MEIKEAATKIACMDGTTGCAAESLIEAIIQKAADTYTADLKAENEKLRQALILIDDAPPIGLDWEWHRTQAKDALRRVSNDTN